MGEAINAYKILFGKPEWKRPLGRCRRRSEGRLILECILRVGGCGLDSSGSG
jgi:hypothetical protein